MTAPTPSPGGLEGNELRAAIRARFADLFAVHERHLRHYDDRAAADNATVMFLLSNYPSAPHMAVIAITAMDELADLGWRHTR